jgi:nucleoside-diphosphate-sugar epimerase
VWGEKDPEHCWQTNVVGTENIVKAAKVSPLKPWILYASSREIYGQKKDLPVKIDAEYEPLNIYARSKVAAEKEILQARKPGLCTAIIRYSSVYGSVDDHETRVVPAFCRAATNGDHLRIDGLDNTLDFTHVDDVVKGTIAVINKLEGGDNALPPLHLTTGVPTTLLQLAKLASDAAGRELNFIKASSRSYDVAKFYGDTAKTTQLLGWKAKIPVKQGVYDLVQLFKSISKE